MSNEQYDTLIDLLAEMLIKINETTRRVDALEKQCGRLWSASGKTNKSISELDDKIKEVKKITDNLECTKLDLRELSKDEFREALKHIKIERIY